MPAIFVFQEVDALALEGAGDDGDGLVFDFRGEIERFEDVFQIVAVNLIGLPAEGGEAAGVDGGVVLVHGGVALAQAVDVHQSDQVVELVVTGKGGCFPHRSFRGLAIAHENIDAVAGPVVLGGPGHARAHTQPLAQRAGGYGRRSEARGGMAFELAAQLAERQQLLGGKQPGLSPGGVENGGGVALGEYEAVVAGMGRVGGVVAHDVEEERADQVGRGQATGGVAGAGGGGGAQGMDAQAGGLLAQQLNGLVLCHGRPPVPD